MPFVIHYGVAGAGALLGIPGRGRTAIRGAALPLAIVALACYPLATQLWEASAHPTVGWAALAVLAAAAMLGLRVVRGIPLARCAAVITSVTIGLAALCWHARSNIWNEHREPYYYAISAGWG